MKSLSRYASLVVFAAVLGAIFLREPFGRQRLIGACAVALGVMALRL